MLQFYVPEVVAVEEVRARGHVMSCDPDVYSILIRVQHSLCVCSAAVQSCTWLSHDHCPGSHDHCPGSHDLPQVQDEEDRVSEHEFRRLEQQLDEESK